MAAEHGALYEELLCRMPAADRPPGRHGSGDAAPPPEPAPPSEPAVPPRTAALRGRRPDTTPLVSVIVPCFNHGSYLADCLRSITQQDYRPLEIIVVDDGSTDPDTQAALGRAERDADTTVLRLPVNRGPSAARNAGVERARGRYVLPVDADNLLLPGAVTALVLQLSSANERIGFVYPNCQFFGNRTDYFESPSYNLHSLLTGNYCDTSSLIDRDVLDRGFRYPEDIVHGHEDWDFVLSLAEHGIHGEAARAKTLLYRKHGFTRSDLVEAGAPFGEVVAGRHPRLFDPAARARIKSEWNPAATVIVIDPLPEPSDDALPNVITGAARQSCQDFEVVIQTTHEVSATPLGSRLRRIPSAASASRAQALARGLEISRGRWVLATYGSPAALFSDPTLMEKVLRVLGAANDVDALALGEVGPEVAPFRLLDAGRAREARLVALCWTTIGVAAPPAALEVAQDDPLEALARWLSGHGRVQWRQLARRERRPSAAGDGRQTVRIGAPRLARARDAQVRNNPPCLPGSSSGMSERLDPATPWIPPQARLLCRHYEHHSGRYLLTNDSAPPPGCSLHYVLGCVRAVPLAGTLSLVRADHGEQPVTLGDAAELDAQDLLGFVEQAPLPLFDALQIGRLPTSGQQILIAGAEDPLAVDVVEPRTIGFIEAYPVHPRHAPHVDAAYGVVGLIRTVDHGIRRHRYGAGHVPPGRLAGELGALLSDPVGDCLPLWIDAEGRVLAGGLGRPRGRPSPASAVRWAGEPLSWKGFSSRGPKLRAVARRAYDAALTCAAGPDGGRAELGAPAGYLSRSPTGRTVALYAGIHPVTGDQLLASREAEVVSMGYTGVELLGYLGASAPLTGKLGTAAVGVPWALRFGMPPGAP
jgi:hypothetical protein